MSAPVKLRHHIGGARVPGAGARWRSVNPARPGEAVGAGRLADAAQVTAAVDAAATAAAEWAAAPIAERAAILRGAAAILRGNAADWGAELAAEEGKTRAEGVAEFARAAAVLDYQAGEDGRDAGEVHHSPRVGERIEVLRRPLGVVALITPFNFPVAIPAWKAAPALVHGNTVVLKPSPLAALPALRLAEALERAGLPPGVLNLVLAEPPDTDPLLADPRVAAVSFTGSTAVGRGIAAACAARGVPVQAELGGKNPAVVLADADLDLAAAQVLAGAFDSAGQKCTATSRVAVVREVAGEFTRRLVAGARARVLGDPLAEAVDLGPLIGADARGRALAGVRAAVDAGAQLLAGGDAAAPADCPDGWFLEPTVLRVPDAANPAWVEELFAPVLAVLVVDDAEAAFTAADAGELGLSAAVFTDSATAMGRAVERLETGVLHLNSATTGADPHVPFGGAGASGYGPREQGRAAREFFTRPVTVYLAGGRR